MYTLDASLISFYKKKGVNKKEPYTSFVSPASTFYFKK